MALGGSYPPRRLLGFSCSLRSSTSGHKLTTQSTPEASLSRLVTLVNHLAVWKLLSKMSQWVLQTVETESCLVLARLDSRGLLRHWPALHETFAVVVQDQGVFTKEQHILLDQGQAQMSSCLSHVEKTLVLVPGSHFGSSLSSRNAHDRCISHRLAGDHEWSLSSESVGRPSLLMTNKLSGDVGNVSSNETLPPRPEWPS